VALVLLALGEVCIAVSMLSLQQWPC